MGKTISFIIQLVLLALVAFGLHFLIHSITKDLPLWDGSYMHLWQIYAVQLLLSVLLVFVTVGIGQNMPHYLGYVFLGALTLKIVVNYILISPALAAGTSNDFFKHNFLIVFFLFMFFDVYVTYRVLNQLHSSEKN